MLQYRSSKLKVVILRRDVGRRDKCFVPLGWPYAWPDPPRGGRSRRLCGGRRPRSRGRRHEKPGVRPAPASAEVNRPGRRLRPACRRSSLAVAERAQVCSLDGCRLVNAVPSGPQLERSETSRAVWLVMMASTPARRTRLTSRRRSTVQAHTPKPSACICLTTPALASRQYGLNHSGFVSARIQGSEAQACPS